MPAMNENMSAYKPDWLEAKQRMTDWWSGKKVDRVVASVIAPLSKAGMSDYIDKTPEKYTDADTVFHNLGRQLNNTFWGGEAFPEHFVYFGPMYSSMVYFGATPNFASSTTWYEPCFNSLDDIMAYKPDPKNNKWWQAIIQMQKKSVEISAGAHLVTCISVGAIIDTLAGLLGNEELLCAMADEPEKVIKARDMLLEHTIPTFDDSYEATKLCNGYGNTALGVWAPGRARANQCDLCVMISPQMFDEFVFYDMKHMYDGLDHGMYHLDGEEEIKHLDSLLKIDKLHMIQWVPSTRVNESSYSNPMNWIDLFKRIQNAGRKVLIINARYDEITKLLDKIDRDLVYLQVSCPDEQTARKVLRELERR